MARFKEGTIPYALLNRDWSNHTTVEIAEELQVSRKSVGVAICRLRNAGFEVKFKRMPQGRYRGRNVEKHKKGTVAWSLMNDDWSDLTVKQIAEVLGVAYDTVWGAIYRLKQDGIIIPHSKAARPKKRDE